MPLAIPRMSVHLYFQQPLIEAKASSRLSLVLIPYNNDPMPLGFRAPFVICVLP